MLKILKEANIKGIKLNALIGAVMAGVFLFPTAPARADQDQSFPALLSSFPVAFEQDSPFPPSYREQVTTQYGPPSTLNSVRAAWGASTPGELVDFWLTAGKAEFFQVRSRQQGLTLYSPEESFQETEKAKKAGRIRDTDVVIGKFQGDYIFLVYAADPQNSPQVLVSDEFDPRDEWDTVATSLKDFLVQYRDSSAEEFWMQ